MRAIVAACVLSTLAFSNAFSAAWAACPVAELKSNGLAVLQRPVDGELADGFGLRMHPLLQIQRMHTGADYAAEAGTPVHASAAGEVVFAAPDGGYGKRVVIAHGNGNETAYGHLLRIDVNKGDCVAQGGTIGTVGATGLSVRNQLHFEVLRHGRFIDPAIVLARRP